MAVCPKCKNPETDTLTPQKYAIHSRWCGHVSKRKKTAPTQPILQQPQENIQVDMATESIRNTHTDTESIRNTPPPPPPQIPIPASVQPSASFTQSIEDQIMDPRYKASAANPYAAQAQKQAQPQQPQQPQQQPQEPGLLQALLPAIAKPLIEKFLTPQGPSIWEEIGKASYASFMGSFAKSHGTALGKEKAKKRLKDEDTEADEEISLQEVIMSKFGDIAKKQEQEKSALVAKIEELEKRLKPVETTAKVVEPPALPPQPAVQPEITVATGLKEVLEEHVE